MRFSRCHPRGDLLFAVAFSAIGLAGCGDFCVVGFSNNGNGSVNVNGGNPAPACSLPHVNGTMRVVALRSPVCETCAAAARVEHVFVTLRSIQLRSDASGGTNSPGWLELASNLAEEPHQIDLMGDSAPEILAANASVPAGSYREVHLQMFSGSQENAERLPAGDACGGSRWNCLVMGDGRVEPMRISSDASDLLIPLQSMGSDSVVVLPDARVELRLSLEPRLAPYFSSAEGWKLQNVLEGRATVVRQSSFELESAALN